MSGNGSNTWDVGYSHITWFQRFLEKHENVANIRRHDDIVFELDRTKPGDHLTILCCREYTMGLTMVLRALAEFGKLNIIYIGGGWNGYTEEAKDYCLDAQIGLYVTEELSGALWRTDYWAYYRKDKDGDLCALGLGLARERRGLGPRLPGKPQPPRVCAARLR